MTSSRSLLGRVSFWWAAGFVVLALTTWLRSRHGAPGGGGSDVTDAVADQLYAQAHLLFFAVLGGAFALFAGAYLILEQFRRGRRRRLLGGLHFTATVLGVLLLTPFIAILAFGVLTARGADAGRAFAAWTTIAGAGYGVTLGAQLFFVAVLLDALRREPDPR